jgi:spore maturation protein CgeB
MLLLDSSLYAPASPLFLSALEESGSPYSFFDESIYTAPLTKSFVHKVARRLLGGRPLTAGALNRDFVRRCREFCPDVVLIVKGSHLQAEMLVEVKRITGATIVNYATDDPFNVVNSNPDMLACISHYDLYVCTKKAIMPDVLRSGAKQACFVPFGYHPAVHFPELPATSQERARFCCDVAFIGGADTDRMDLVKDLAKIPTLKVNLYGGGWDRFSELRACARGFAYGRDYRLAVSGAKVVIGLVRRANRDGHAMRTFEIPACRGFMLAERTQEHLEFFQEGKHCECFASASELIEKVMHYVDHAEERDRVALAGYKAVVAGRHTYADRLRQIMSAV